MRYNTYNSTSGRPVYQPTWTILSGPDKNGTCKCFDEAINATVFLNIKDLEPIQESKCRVPTGQ